MQYMDGRTTSGESEGFVREKAERKEKRVIPHVEEKKRSTRPVGDKREKKRMKSAMHE